MGCCCSYMADMRARELELVKRNSQEQKGVFTTDGWWGWQVREVIAALHENSHVRYFYADSCGTFESAATVRAFAEMLAINRNIIDVTSKYSVSLEHVPLLLSGLQRHPPLRNFNLFLLLSGKELPFDWAPLLAYLQHSVTLTELGFRCPFGSAGFNGFLTVVRTLPALQTVTLFDATLRGESLRGLLSAVLSSPRIASLHLYECLLVSDEDAPAIAEFIRRTSALDELHIGQHVLSAVGLQMILASLRCNSSLHTIDIATKSADMEGCFDPLRSENVTRKEEAILRAQAAREEWAAAHANEPTLLTPAEPIAPADAVQLNLSSIAAEV